MVEMIDGTPLNSLSGAFEMLHLGSIDPPVFLHEESDCHLTRMLFCHESMEENGVHVPLGAAHSTLVLPEWLRGQADTLTSADWARLCEVGVAAATQHEGEECEMPMLELSARDEGFCW